MAVVNEIRNLFPALSRKVYGKDLVYFDNAATSQRSQEVIYLWNRISIESNANIHRAVHRLADEATQAYEASRDVVKDFINAGSREEIVFTSGATAAVNLVAFSFGEAFVKEGDEVIVTEAEHHSDIVPWQMMCQRKGAVLKVLPVDEYGHLMVEKLDDLLSEKTRIMAVTHISNVLGIINPVKEIIGKCHSKGVAVLVDGPRELFTARWMCRILIVISMYFPVIRCMRQPVPESCTERKNGWNQCLRTWEEERWWVL